MKIGAFALVFLFFGFLLGYSGMYVLDTGILFKTEVLSFAETKEPELTPEPAEETTPTNTHTPTLTPTPSPSPTPKPSPTPTPVPVAPAELEAMFEMYSSAFSVDKEQLKKIAKCESNFNPGAFNDPYAGLFQFTEKSWSTYRNLMGADPNPQLRFGGRESIETAAFVLSLGNDNIWPSCK